jgi:hypothetical protein
MTKPHVLERLRFLEREQERHARICARLGEYRAADFFRRFAADTAAIRTLLDLHSVRELRKPAVEEVRRETDVQMEQLLDAQPHRAGGGGAETL